MLSTIVNLKILINFLKPSNPQNINIRIKTIFSYLLKVFDQL